MLVISVLDIKQILSLCINQDQDNITVSIWKSIFTRKVCQQCFSVNLSNSIPTNVKHLLWLNTLLDLWILFLKKKKSFYREMRWKFLFEVKPQPLQKNANERAHSESNSIEGKKKNPKKRSGKIQKFI